MFNSFVALGSNLGKRQTSLRAALARMAALPGTSVHAVATFRQTLPVDAPANSPAFINSAAHLRTSLSARDLLAHLLSIEQSLGRTRSAEPLNAPRIIDLDLLLHDNQIIDDPHLTIPHPRMHQRRFVLEPLAEIAPNALHPTSGKTIAQLLADLDHHDPLQSPAALVS